MSNFPMDTPGGWGDECWVQAPDPVPETCVAPTDLDEILEMPFQDELTVGSGVERFQDMIADLPPVPVERQAALHELLTPAPWWGELAAWWVIGSTALTALALVAAILYILYDRRRGASAPSVDGEA